MKRWLVALGSVAIWALLSVAYGYAALLAVALAFGREGNGYHVIGLLAALLLWGAATMWAAARLWRLASTHIRQNR